MQRTQSTVSILGIISLAVSLCTPLHAGAKGNDSLLAFQPERHLVGTPLVLKPQPKHHFNTKAPNRCGEYTIDRLTDAVFSCTPTKPGPLTITAAVCDEGETFCKLERFTVKVVAK